MTEFFDKTFYGNTIGDWAIALAIIVGTILIARLVYLVISKVISFFTKKTATRLDDIILEKLKEPALFAFILAGFWFGINFLHLSDGVDNLVKHAFYFAITFNVAWIIARLLDALLDEYLAPMVAKSENDLDDQMLPIARKAAKYAIWILAIVVGLNNAGYDVGALIAGLGLGGLAFALAAKDSISHIFGGFVIFTDKPFKIKDRIQVKGIDGNVEQIGIRSTRIRTFDGRLVTIPNADIANDTIINVSSEPSRRVVVDLGLTYDTPASKMQEGIEIVKKITADIPDLDEEKTIAAFTEFKDFSLNLKFIYFIKKGADIFAVMNAVNKEVLNQFNAAGLEFAFPTQTIYTVKEKK
jgi:MscS family membrane protein